MEYNIEYFKGLVKAIKFPKIKLRYMEKPPRWVVVSIAILLEIILMFIILWLFDERTVFDNDYIEKRSWGSDLKWGWVHMGVTITLVLAAIAWAIVILDEFMSWKEEDRVFYNLYR